MSRLALLRNELDVVEEMIDQDVPRRGHDWMVTSATVSTRLDGLLALGRREDVEREAAPFITDRSVLRPALRALGAAREDEELLKDAIQRFEALGSAGTPSSEAGDSRPERRSCRSSASWISRSSSSAYGMPDASKSRA